MKLPKLYADSSAFTAETWLKAKISDSEVLSSTFSAFRTDRPSRKGGGVLIGFTTCPTSERIHFDIPNEIEFVSMKVSLHSLSVFVTCSYIPPGSDLLISEYHLSASKSFLSLLFNRDLLIVLGDFSLPNIS